MKKKINERAGSTKKQKNQKQLKKKNPEQIIVVEKEKDTKEEVTFINWVTFSSENQGLL